MSRARNIKPGLYKNEDLAECSIWARFLFPGLWMLADREGRLEDRPKRIKGELFPYDNLDIDECLNELKQWGFIKRYVADGKSVIEVINFLQHQSPHGKESDSELPDEHGIYTVHERDKRNGCVTGNSVKHSAIAVCDGIETDTSTVLAQDKNCASTVLAHPSSLIPESLIPESLIPESLIPESERDLKISLVPSGTTKKTKKPDFSDEFETAWAMYPKRSGADSKADAFKQWRARLKSGESTADMLAGVVRYQKFCDQSGKSGTEYVMQAKRFFGAARHYAEAWTYTPPPSKQELVQRRNASEVERWLSGGVAVFNDMGALT